MKNTTNVFLKGMTSDMHPLTTSQLEYTDALNATLVTFNGNEQMMLNDMGNTKIQDSKTGNLMGLREGFIPVGLKEHGGIMYIASVNKEGEGEIGTIPSPVIRYNKKDECEFTFLQNGNYQVDPEKGYGDLVKLTGYLLKAGDKFVVYIPITSGIYAGTKTFSFANSSDKKIPIIQKIIKRNGEVYSEGIYKVGLYSQTDDLTYNLNDLIDNTIFTFPVYGLRGKIENYNNGRWFIDNSNKEINIDSAFVNELSDETDSEKVKSFITYPRISSGYPSARLEINRLDFFALLPNQTSTDFEDNTRRYPFTILDDQDLDNINYITYIRGFDYTSANGIHPTKLTLKLIEDSTGNILLNETKSDSDFYKYIVDGSNSNFRISFINEETFEELNNNYYNKTDHSNNGIPILIGDNSNIWLTLTVDYYYENIKLGTYTCRYNPYIYDTLNNFKKIKYIPNDNYNGFGNIWYQLYYDIKSRTAANLERTASGVYVSNGDSGSYPNASGCGINLEKYKTEDGNFSNSIGNYRFNETERAYILLGDNELELSEKPYSINYKATTDPDSLITTYKYSFYRNGVNIKNITGTKDYNDLNTNINGYTDSLLDNRDYLYNVNKITQDISESKISLYYYLNNLGFRIYCDDAGTGNLVEWKDKVELTYSILPESKTKTKTIDCIKKQEYLGSLLDYIVIFGPESYLPQGKIEVSGDIVKNILNGNQSLFRLSGSVIETEKNCDTEIAYLDGDPWMSKHNYCNDSRVELEVNVINKLNVSGISDYQVIPLINCIYEEDGLLYPGHDAGNDNIEELDVDISYNYFLKNGISEGNYVFNTSYYPFEATSIYGQGFGKYSMKDSSLNIELGPGTYIINFNIFAGSDDVSIGFKFDSALNNKYPNSDPENDTETGDYIYKISTDGLFAFLIDNNCILKSIELISANDHPSLTFTSCGLYKAKPGYDINNPPKFQTVYTYSEYNKKCLDKTYYYSGGSAFCGYLKSADIYTIDSSENTHNVQIRREANVN